MGSLDVWEFSKDRQIDRRISGSGSTGYPVTSDISTDCNTDAKSGTYANNSTDANDGTDKSCRADDAHVPAEWYSELDGDFNPINVKNLVDEWKCPYHNGRMCIELIRRLTEKN